MPFADATAIAYTQALWIAIFAAPILGEVVTRRQWFGIVLGFAGILILVRPGFSESWWLYVGIVLGSSFNALVLVLTRYMQRRDSALTVMF
ncbi:MAG: EamA family transporter [Acetobacteraceae bacterium]|nr:EamA family transporter [Acetobacteraceae bacterium]